MNLKVFRMDECSCVCAKSKEEAIEWYVKGFDDPADVDVDGVVELDIEKDTMEFEVSLGDIVNELEFAVTNKCTVVHKRLSGYWIQRTFKEVIESMIQTQGYVKVAEEPFEIASTEC
ncbi:hypothetical protein [Petroclostridium sp. X23]|uniref:hypothetical protein n=1 Tax=Petroclostridium sp. X23 TaxID=3045146 RepID=UPI0024AD026A|nr:hypothetical protein [Petroclostridium sp. X23]WHH59136.1 hypothetical protein QKW49_25680 [Petroclostridium sp. X23]